MYKLGEGKSFKQIGIEQNRHPSTISREFVRGLVGNAYSIENAQKEKLAGNKKRGRKRKLTEEIWEKMKPQFILGWSPQQIVKKMKEDQEATVSAKTIYRYIQLHLKGTLKKKALVQLRRKGKTRSKSLAKDNRGKLKNMTLIDERPLSVEDRTISGNWEGDLIVGKNHKSALVVAVERSTRYLMLAKTTKFDAKSVRKKFENLFARMPQKLKKTLTYDQGKEMGEHELFSKNTKVKVYFCHPHSPWEKGTCENTNGLIRDILRGINDFTDMLPSKLRWLEMALNTRPRETLNWDSPEKRILKLLR